MMLCAAPCDFSLTLFEPLIDCRGQLTRSRRSAFMMLFYRWSLLSFWHLDLAHIITCGLERTLELVTRDVAVAVGVGLVDRRPVRSAICM
jgi:hypothetical protein